MCAHSVALRSTPMWISCSPRGCRLPLEVPSKSEPEGELIKSEPLFFLNLTCCKANVSQRDAQRMEPPPRWSFL